MSTDPDRRAPSTGGDGAAADSWFAPRKRTAQPATAPTAPDEPAQGLRPGPVRPSAEHPAAGAAGPAAPAVPRPGRPAGGEHPAAPARGSRYGFDPAASGPEAGDRVTSGFSAEAGPAAPAVPRPGRPAGGEHPAAPAPGSGGSAFGFEPAAVGPGGFGFGAPAHGFGGRPSGAATAPAAVADGRASAASASPHAAAGPDQDTTVLRRVELPVTEPSAAAAATAGRAAAPATGSVSAAAVPAPAGAIPLQREATDAPDDDDSIWAPDQTMQLRVLPQPEAEADPGFAFAEPVRPGWTLPPVPDVAWSAAASRRRTWISRGMLLALLIVQAVLSLRLTNSAFEDEALYLYAGHAEIAQLFHGAPDYGGFASYFSGAPTLYPVLAAAVDSVFGLAGARALSLLFMLGANALLYSFTRRLFNERAGLCASVLFAFAQSTLFLGNFATYDAMAVFLLALATWIVVRTGHGHWSLPLAAAPVAALAVGVKYASALYLPTIALLLLLVAYQRHGVLRAVLRSALFTAGVGGLLAAAVLSTDYLAAISSTTTARAHGDTPTLAMIQDSARWGGLLFAVACIGTALYGRRARLSEVPGWRQAVPGARWRTALGLLLTGTALLAPAYQIHLQTSTSLHKHIGFGLLFAAPLAGVGVTRLMGAHFKFPQFAIAISVLALTMGMSQSAKNYGIWPDTKYLIQDLSYKVQPGQRWLGEPHEGPVYYLSGMGRTSYPQWTSVYYIDYTGRPGQHLSGIPGYRAALQDGWFDGVVLDWSDGAGEVPRAIRDELRKGGKYRLSSALPYQTSAGKGHFEVWLKQQH
ncbi:glycosyltransferase family 39 protein [Kitasatospora sp. NPDC002227]|uniref:glycosyltransferase family 39 protein n=1 Tax=Kitasatospora sp. NPDC002227 TaxID=3154773 RepID=UPI003318A039